MYAENHSILKRCEVYCDGNNIKVLTGNIKQVVPVFTVKDANLSKLYANET